MRCRLMRARVWRRPDRTGAGRPGCERPAPRPQSRSRLMRLDVSQRLPPIFCTSP
ncbi:Uncharacterised protein [Bordetella pertussis]|nr:Uncharacterised protein [Bordetella pertussis]